MACVIHSLCFWCMLTVNKSLILLLVLMYSMFPETKLIIDTAYLYLLFATILNHLTGLMLLINLKIIMFVLKLKYAVFRLDAIFSADLHSWLLTLAETYAVSAFDPMFKVDFAIPLTMYTLLFMVFIGCFKSYFYFLSYFGHLNLNYVII